MPSRCPLFTVSDSVVSESRASRVLTTLVAERTLCGAAGVTVPAVGQVLQRSPDQAGRQVKPVGDVLGAVLPTVGWSGGDDPGGFKCGFGRGEVREPFVDQQLTGTSAFQVLHV